MNACRAAQIARMAITADAAVSAIPIPDTAVSLVIDSESCATLLIRWGSTPVDLVDLRGGWDVEVPGGLQGSLCSMPIPEGIDTMSIAWKVPPGVYPDGTTYNVDVNQTGDKAITIWATPNNQGTSFALKNSEPAPAVET